MKGSRTVAFNVLMAVIGITGAEVSPELVNEFINYFVGVWTVGNLILRAVTNTPIFKPQHGDGGGP